MGNDRYIKWIFKYYVHILLCSLITFGCVAPSTRPMQVGDDNATFGHYQFRPPKGYWYFTRHFPQKFDNSEGSFLITFWEDQKAILKESSQERVKPFFNFSVSQNIYIDIDSYYNSAKAKHVNYKSLPEKARDIENMSNWSCKYIFQGFHGLECIAILDNLITFAVIGSDADEVFSRTSALKQMIESFTIVSVR